MPKITLQKRERNVVAIFSVLLVVFIIYMGAQGPLAKYRRSIKNLHDARARIKQMRIFETQIMNDRSGHEALKKLVAARAPGFDLYEFLYKLSESSFKDRARIQSQDSPLAGAFSVVGLQMNGVSLQEVVDFLYKVYASKDLIIVPKVDYIRVAKDGKGLECQMTFAAPRA